MQFDAWRYHPWIGLRAARSAVGANAMKHSTPTAAREKVAPAARLHARTAVGRTEGGSAAPMQRLFHRLPRFSGFSQFHRSSRTFPTRLNREIPDGISSVALPQVRL